MDRPAWTPADPNSDEPPVLTVEVLETNSATGATDPVSGVPVTLTLNGNPALTGTKTATTAGTVWSALLSVNSADLFGRERRESWRIHADCRRHDHAWGSSSASIAVLGTPGIDNDAGSCSSGENCGPDPYDWDQGHGGDH